MLTNGTALHGRYRIVRQIGCGGMGAVYEAIDWRLENTVAVKQCQLPGVEADRAFEREAKLLAALRHPALPVVIDYFVEGQEQFLVMQFIEGDDLGKLLEHRRGHFPAAEVVVWARTVLDALCYLHNHVPPVVHRDIKPANLRRTPRGAIALLDFGLAKGLLGGLPMPPADRSVFGYTLSYSPLEQIEGRRTDPRSDVYAVGATLYHFLTGRAPVNARERMRAVESGAPDPLSAAHAVEADVPEALGRLIARAMALDPTDRYSSAREMQAALSDCEMDETTRVSPSDHRPESRRIDAAVQSRTKVGSRIDLLVQVRFAGSPRLGLEDWPTKERPSEIEQVSEALQVAYPTDPQTGRILPARLRIKVVAPDVRVESQIDRLIEVPPDEYSKRLSFLLTPLRTGPCRINVEVYGLDDLFLGTVPVELAAVAAAVSDQDVSVGNLVLEVVARQVATLLLGAGVAAAASQISLAANDAGSVAMPSRPSAVPMVTSSILQPTVAAELSVTPSARKLETREAEAGARLAAPETVGAARSSEVHGSRGEAASAPSHPLSTSPARGSSSPDPSAVIDPRRSRLWRAAIVSGPIAFVAIVAMFLNTRAARETLPLAVEPAPSAAAGSPAPASTASMPDPTPQLKSLRPPAPPPMTPPAPTPIEEPVKADRQDLARVSAQGLVTEAKRLARSDIVGAVKRVSEAQALDPQAAGATELMNALQNQLEVQGEVALTSARNFDRVKRTADAIREFDRAIQLLELLPRGHKDLAFARQRSAALKALR